MVASLARRIAWPQALGEHIALARPSRHIARPQALGARITVALIPTVAGDLRRLQRRTKLSATDLTNRAITSYAFLDAQMRAGNDLIVRDNGTGQTKLVRFQ